MNIITAIKAVLLQRNNWWNLYLSAHISPIGSAADLAFRLKQKIEGGYVGKDAEIAGQPCMPHKMSGVCISGGQKSGRTALFFSRLQ